MGCGVDRMAKNVFPFEGEKFQIGRCRGLSTSEFIYHGGDVAEIIAEYDLKTLDSISYNNNTYKVDSIRPNTDGEPTLKVSFDLPSGQYASSFSGNSYITFKGKAKKPDIPNEGVTLNVWRIIVVQANKRQLLIYGKDIDKNLANKYDLDSIDAITYKTGEQAYNTTKFAILHCELANDGGAHLEIELEKEALLPNRAETVWLSRDYREWRLERSKTIIPVQTISKVDSNMSTNEPPKTVLGTAGVKVVTKEYEYRNGIKTGRSRNRKAFHRKRDGAHHHLHRKQTPEKPNCAKC